MTPSVSVIIPTYNRAILLERAIRSVLSQTYRDFEIIVIDDASIDNTQEMVKEKFKQEMDSEILKYVRNEKNMERSFSRNKGMQLAQGHYIALLDDDDIWLPEHLTTLINYLNEKPDVGIVFSNYLSLCEDGTAKIGVRGIKSGEGDFYRDLCISKKFAHNSIHLLRKSVYEHLGGFKDVEFGEEREFFSRVAMNYNVGYITKVTTCIYAHSGSYTYSPNKTQEYYAYIKEKVWKIIEENSKKYSYPIKNRIRAEFYLYLSQCFLPNIPKTREYLFKAIKIEHRLFLKLNTWGLLLRVILGKHFYLMLKKLRKVINQRGSFLSNEKV